MRLLISAGEASGDFCGAQLITALRRREPALDCFGVGGEGMRAAGCQTVVDARDVAVVGLGEVVSHLPRIWREFRKLLRQVDVSQPDAAVLIDFPDFNFRLARELHKRGVPVIYYVSPQLWAWRPGRIELVRRYVRKMLVIFPFEEAWYRERGVEAEYVGHPLADVPPPREPREDFAMREVLDPARNWVALLPGSRRKEVALNLPDIMKAVGSLGDKYQYVLPVAPTLDPQWLDTLVNEHQRGRSFDLSFTRDVRGALSHARAAVVASGTATVEAALLGTPFVMVYRVSPLTWWLGRPLVKVPYFAMPNLIAGRGVVPELVQADFTDANVAARLREILDDGPARQQMLAGLAEVRTKLAPPTGSGAASERAATALLRALGRDAGRTSGLN
jgi:lipid-A-disaccharide synthase